MKFKLWIATDGDGGQFGFIPKPIRNVGDKFWTLEEPGFLLYDAIVLDQFNILPNQKWEDEPQLVELTTNSSSLSREEIIKEIDKRIAEQYELIGVGHVDGTAEENVRRRLAKINGLEYAKSSLLVLITDKEIDNE